VIVRERLFVVSLVKGNNGVPESVELVDGTMLLELETVSTSVSMREVFAVSGSCMEGLVDITYVVDQEAEVEGVAKGVAHRRRRRLILAWLGVLECIFKLGDDPRDVEVLGVPVVLLEVIEERSVDEVPVGLGVPALGLDLVCESGALYEWVLVFECGKLRKLSQNAFRLGNQVWVGVLEDIVSNASS